MDLLKKLRKTPFHPQWFAFLREESNLRSSCASLHGMVLDIGCADGKTRRSRLVETAAFAANIAISKTALNWIAARNPLAIFTALLAPLILARSCFAWLIATSGRYEDMMYYSYPMFWTQF